MTAVVDVSPLHCLEPDNRALQAALELSMVNISSSMKESDLSFNYWDGCEVNSKSLNVTQCVSVPSSEHVAEIVGKQGCKIKALRAKTNTYIKTPARGEEPVFSISGRPDHVQTAKWEIIAAADHFSQIRASRPSSSSSSSSHISTDKVTIYVRVPYRVVGLVVGPRGATVKRIQQLTRTFIVTPSRDKEPCFEVRGSPENVQRARVEIERYIVLRTGNKCSMEEAEDVDVYGSAQSIDLLTQQMQQCQVMDSAAFPYPTFPELMVAGKMFPGEGLEIPCANANIMDGSGQVLWSSNPLPTVFTGMQFTPPDASYRPMSAPLLSPEAFDFSRVKSQPLSPTGSYESNSSDGLAAVSPNQSPLVPKRGAGAKSFCCMCRSTEDMAALMPCGHNMFCQTCAHYIACSSGSCPLCNAQVTNVMHII